MIFAQSHTRRSFPRLLHRTITDLPIPRKLGLITGLFSIVVFSILLLSYFGMEILSGSRAYVGGEGLWSKAQKQAVLALGHYAWSHDEKDYQAFSSALEIPLGDRQARLELEKPAPDFEAVFTGFLRGGNHPKDIPSMIHMFRRFRHVSYMNDAIGFWRQADGYIADLQAVGDQVHREMTSQQPSVSTLERLLIQAQEINSKLTPLENAFSSTLGEGSRWMKASLLTVMVLVTGVFLAMTLAVAFLISRHLCQEIDQLRAGAAQITGGDFHVTLDVRSQDEIGDLARTFQEMAIQRERAEERLTRQARDLEAANQELEAFSYSVSHDLRTPLRAIDGFSRELLVNCETRLDESGKKDLQRIVAATRHMGQLIDDLLELSHLSRRELRRQAVDLSALVHQIAQKMQTAEPERSVEFAVAPHAVAQGDPHLLQIALENLIQNSWKFSQKQPRTTIEFGVLNQEHQEAFFIKDNGAGFSMAYVGKLFKPFERLHDPNEYPGTGIGLALVQRIIHRHGGQVWAEAEENHGAVFYFTLC